MITAETLTTRRRWAIVIAFIVAAVLTPPDPISQISLALPTIVLYEISIFAVRYVEKARRAAEAGARSRGRSCGVIRYFAGSESSRSISAYRFAGGRGESAITTSRAASRPRRELPGPILTASRPPRDV